MKINGIRLTATLLALALVGYITVINQDIRTVEFITILAIGTLFGVFLTQVFQFYRNSKKKSL